MRCLTLASSLKKNGATIQFICRKLQGNLIRAIRELGFEVLELPLGDDESWLGTSIEKEISQSETLLKKSKSHSSLVVDHYALDFSWESVMKPLAGQIVVIDDLANRKHECDLLIDQNFIPNRESAYKSLLPNNVKLFIGPHFALIRDSFTKTKP